MERNRTMTEVLRQCVLDDERNWYKVATLAQIDRGALIRFAEGKVSIRLEAADRLAELYGLELTPRKGAK
jgi:hypothetical protein